MAVIPWAAVHFPPQDYAHREQPMTPFAIRYATPDDVTILHLMIQEMAQFLSHEHVVLVTEDDLKEHLFQNRMVDCIIADLQPSGPAIGYSIFYPTFSTFRGRPGIHVEDIFVRDGFREKNVGRALVHRITEIATERNACRIQWEAPILNRRARLFYDSLDVPTITGWVTYRITNAISDMAESRPGYSKPCPPSTSPSPRPQKRNKR